MASSDTHHHRDLLSHQGDPLFPRHATVARAAAGTSLSESRACSQQVFCFSTPTPRTPRPHVVLDCFSALEHAPGSHYRRPVIRLISHLPLSVHPTYPASTSHFRRSVKFRCPWQPHSLSQSAASHTQTPAHSIRVLQGRLG